MQSTVSEIDELKNTMKNFLLQIDDLIESFFETEDASTLDDIPPILLHISEYSPRNTSVPRSDSSLFSLVRKQSNEELQNDLLFFASSFEESNVTEEQEEDKGEDASFVPFSENALLLLDDFLDEVSEQLSTFESSFVGISTKSNITACDRCFSCHSYTKGRVSALSSVIKKNICAIFVKTYWHNGAMVLLL